MNDLSNRSVLVIDHGIFFPLAQRLARDFGEVGYHVNWKRGFPSYNELDIGEGFENVRVVRDMWDEIDKFDLLCFPDLLDADKQIYLRKQGYRVWGSGKGEELELFRFYAKQVMKAVGLPVNGHRMVKGIDALRDYLKEHDDKFIKVSLLRGITETFHHAEYWQTEARLDELAHTLGIRKHRTDFLIEDPIETSIEYGYDGICIDGKFPKVAANGLEAKDSAYAAVVQDYADLPEGMLEVNEALSSVLANYKYRNFLSTEIRVAKDNTPYLIDITARQPSPAGECEHELWSNLGEMMYHGAAGELIDPVPAAKYAAQAIIYGDRADENWQPISFPEKYRQNVKLYFHVREGGHDFVIPQATKMNEVGSVVALGDTLEAAIEKLKEICETVKGDKIDIHTHAIEKLTEEFEEMEKKGMDLTPA